MFISTNKLPSEKLPSIFQSYHNCFKEIVYQRGKNFHEKYLSTIEQISNQGYDKVVVIGNDTPHLTSDIIQNAFEELNENDIVIGPSNDGGFYLHGFTKFNKELYNGIPWSTKFVTNKLVEKCRFFNLKLESLITLDDIDNYRKLKEVNKKNVEFIRQYFLLFSLICKIKKCCLEQKFLMKLNPFALITYFQLPPPVEFS